MGFFKAFFSSCRGPYAFIELRRQTAWRVILHLVLTVLISCIFISIGRYCALRYFWAQPEREFSENFGAGISVNNQGMLPEKDPGISRRQELPYDGLLLYVSPAGPEKNYPDETLKNRNFILVWTPGYMALALRDARSDRWSFASFDGGYGDGMTQMANNQPGIVKSELTLEGLRKEIAELAAKPLPENFSKEELKNSGFIQTAALFKMMRGTMAVINGAAYFRLGMMLIFFGVCAYMFIFILAERFPGAERRIPAREMWKIAVYTACPVIVVVNVFPMLQLPFESYYEKIFLVGWIIYINVVKRWLEKNHEILENQE